jgi:hypothetical protein
MQILFTYSLIIGIILQYLIMYGLLGSSVKQYIINPSNKGNLFLVIFICILIFTLSTGYILDSSILYCQSTDNITNDIGVTDNTVNVNNPNVAFTLPEGAIQQLTTTLTTAIGITVGVKLAQQISSVRGKALAVVSIALFSQVLNIGTIILIDRM